MILYDRLIPGSALDGARAGAELLFVGKEGGGDVGAPGADRGADPRRARSAGRIVVRLKGGDPFVFGRGGEEALALRAAGIPFEIVPGVTAGVAARGLRGHSRDAPRPIDARSRSSPATRAGSRQGRGDARSTGDALAAFPGTLVFYMGVRACRRSPRSLIAAGRPPAEPAAVVERGTLPGQRTVTGTLATIAEAVDARGRAGALDHGRRPGRGARR